MKHDLHRARRSAHAAGACLIAAATLACVLGGCTAADRYHGPPRAAGYSASVWPGTPADLDNTRVARDR